MNSRRGASHRRGDGGHRAWEPVIGLEMHVELGHADQDVLRLRRHQGRPAQHPHLPGVPGAPRRAARGQQARRRVRRAHRAGAATARCSRATSSTARTTSIRISPRRTRSASTTSRSPSAGRFEYWVDGELLRCRIDRVHMEEDAAKLVHAGGDDGPHRRLGLLHGRLQPRRHAAHRDRHRAGHPVAGGGARVPPAAAQTWSSSWASASATWRRARSAGTPTSASGPAGSDELGTRTELKNMNSFRYLQQALDAEIPRQIEVLEAGGKIDQETLHFDPDTGTTTPLRSKEEAHDYRYFPEPDLVPLEIDPAWVSELRATQPELPAARVRAVHGRLRALARRRARARLVGRRARRLLRGGRAAGPAPSRRPTGRWASTSPISTPPASRPATATSPPSASPSSCARRGRHRLDQRRQGSLRDMIEERAEPEAIVAEARPRPDQRHLGARGDRRRGCRRQRRPGEQYRGGKQQVIGFFVGQVMKASGGRANPRS